MKNYFVFLLLIISFSYLHAQTVASGYYVTKSNDTITTQIKLPKSIFGSLDFSRFLFKVDVIDTNNIPNKLKPEDIKSFGFLFEGNTYRFFSQPTITKNNLRFLEALVLGKKTSIYKFETVTKNGGPLGTFYTFEKADGSYEFFNTGMRNLDKLKEALKVFYKDYGTVHEVIDSKFKSRMAIKGDIIAIAQAVNNTKG